MPRETVTETPTHTSKPTAGEIRAAIEQALAPLSIEVIDDSARHAGHAGAREGGHYRVTLVASAFAGRPKLERHRMVYSALAPLMGRGIHALSIIAHAPNEPLSN
ncbi:MAG TPA: BolA family protein [Steroidobacteraceae bacterium]|nr:BolA family protein [Steroidobacteraceae bacterium]